MKKPVVLVGLLSALGAFAETYYWAGEDFGLYSEPANWRIGSADGAVATVEPGADDTRYGLQDVSIDLGGGAHTLGGWNSEGNWDRHTVMFTNGTLTVTGQVYTHSDTYKLFDGATLIFGSASDYLASFNHSAADEIIVHPNAEMQLLGKVRFYKLKATCEAGGKIVFNPTTFACADCNPNQDSFFKISGLMEAPGGINWTTGNLNPDRHFLCELAEGGTIDLGGNVSKAESLIGKMQFVVKNGTTVKASGPVAFNAVECSVDAGAAFTAQVEAGASLDLSAFTFNDGVTVTKTGAGVLKVSGAGVPTLSVTAGTLVTGGAGSSITNLTLASGTSLEIVGNDLEVTETTVQGPIHASLRGDFSVGSVLVKRAPASFLAAVQAGLAESGVSSTIDGSALKMSASEIVFESTTITDLNTAAGWRSGAVPAAGQSVTIAGADVVAEINGAIPAFGSITVANGATLRVGVETTLPEVKVSAGGTLEVVANATTLASLIFDTNDGTMTASDLASIRLAAGATLKVPGGTAFKNCALDLNGTLEATDDGRLVFGTANANESAFFAMTTDGATITAKNSAGTENAARLDFVVPQVGGNVTVVEPILLKDTTLTYNAKDGMAFGLNNPTDKAFTITAQNTPLEIGADTTVAGAANLALNGSRLLRKRHAEGDTADSMYNIVIQNRGKITVGEGGSVYAGVTRVNGNETDGCIRLQPDEEGFVGMEFLDGSVAHWYKLNGYGKGAVTFHNATFELTKAYWWGWGNRAHIFNQLKAVNLVAGKTLTLKCVKETLYSSNYENYTYFILESPFAGAGNLTIENGLTSQCFQPTIVRGDNTCTGTLSVTDSNTLVHFADGANWAGTVVLNDKIDLVPVDRDHSSAESKPTEISVGGVALASPFSFRVWVADDGTVSNDKINVGAQGWTLAEGATVGFQNKTSNALVDVAPGSEVILGTMPKGGTVPASLNTRLQVKESAIDGNETVSYLVVGPAAEADGAVFTGKDGSTDLNDVNAWAGGAVPVARDVKIMGAGVTAVVDATQGLPGFLSISLVEGATLQIVGTDAVGDDFVLPPLSMDQTATLILGDDAETATKVALPMDFITNAKVTEGNVALSRLIVKKGATAVVPGGARYRNIAVTMDGNLSNENAEGAGPVFGYATAGETTYLAFSSDGGKYDLHSNQNGSHGQLCLAVPEAGGRVKVIGDILLKDCRFVVNGWADFANRTFGVNNPTDEPFDVVFDGTTLSSSWSFTAGGAAHLKLINGAFLRKDVSCINHGFGNTLKDAATLEVVGEGTYIDYAGADSFAFRSTADNVIVRDGGSYVIQKSTGNASGAFVSSNGVAVVASLRGDARTDLFAGFKEVRVEPESKLSIVARDGLGYTGTPWERAVTLADIPMTGSGDVEIENRVGGYPFAVTVSNGENTCSGTIGVTKMADAENVSEAQLLFADGANWAGTVVADGNVGLTGETAATVSFGAVEGALTVRAFGSADTLSLDRVNLTGTGFAEEATLMIRLPEGVEPKPRTFYPLGTLAAGARLPKLQGGFWKVVTETNDGVTTYGIKRNYGFSIVFR